MAGHSHWAGIKHKKGKADKLRSSLFSKLSREITVAAKLGGKDPEMNARLRAAIDTARSSNMPKDNISRAIDKSENNQNTNYEDIRYEGFGPDKIAVIVESLTDNKNRTASNIRTIFQKNGGNLGTQGSSSHNFRRVGNIKINTLRAISAGCNLILHCNANYSEMRIVAENSPSVDNFIIKKTSQFYNFLS